MDGFERERRQRATQSDTAAYTRETGWGTNPITIAARPARILATVELEIASGGTARVATGGQVASATNGVLLDAANGPTVLTTENTGAISIYAIGGAEAITVMDEYTSGGVAL